MSNRYISTYDLGVLEQFKNFSQADFLREENLEIIKTVLQTIGFNTEKEINFQFCQHRDLRGNFRVGYVIRGDINPSSPFFKENKRTIEDILILAGEKDYSLLYELCKLNKIDLQGFKENSYKVNKDFLKEEDFYPETIIARYYE